MAYKWLLLTIRKSWDDPPSTYNDRRVPTDPTPHQIQCVVPEFEASTVALKVGDGYMVAWGGRFLGLTLVFQNPPVIPSEGV